MTRSLTYQELEKINHENEKKLLHLEQNIKSLQINPAGLEKQKHLMVYDALIECVDFLLNQQKFIDVALIIYNKCKPILGADAGYVALIDQPEKSLDVLHLDTGGLTCTVNPSAPMPIRGLRKVALQKGVAVYCNDFNKSKWLKLLPKGHVKLQNVLFAPIVIDQTPAGLLGFANKPDDFNQDDLYIAASFAKLAALALSNSRAWKYMKKKPDYH